MGDILKQRVEPRLLKILQVLKVRGRLSEEDKKYLHSLEKGLQGEQQFDSMTDHLQSNCLVIRDLLLEVNNTEFQIDTVIIYQDSIYLIDIKNFEGDYIYSPETLKTNYGREYKNPLQQLQRSLLLFKQLLQNLGGYNLAVEGFVVFVHSEFTLYQVPVDVPFVFPTQLKRFLKKLDQKPSHLQNTHKRLAEKLISLHKTNSNNAKIPVYEYAIQRKGLHCCNCSSFSVTVDGQILLCKDCGTKEKLSTAIIRMVDELKLLFPDRKITTSEVFEWCGGVLVSKKRINRVLGRHYRSVGVKRWKSFE
jgi:hypothetical protein